MCNRMYATKFTSPGEECGLDRGIEVAFLPEAEGGTRAYDSLVALWDEWHDELVSVGREFPWIEIRYEDLLFREEELVGQVCECVGGTLRADYRHVVGDAKGKGGGGRADSMRKYSDRAQREASWSARDLRDFEDQLDWAAMDALGYRIAGSRQRKN